MDALDTDSLSPVISPVPLGECPKPILKTNPGPIAEVPAAVAHVENLYGVAAAQFLGEAEVGHVRTPHGTVDRKEPQSGGGDGVKLGVRGRHELVRLLGGCVERYRGVDIIHAMISESVMPPPPGKVGKPLQLLSRENPPINGMPLTHFYSLFNPNTFIEKDDLCHRVAWQGDGWEGGLPVVFAELVTAA